MLPFVSINSSSKLFSEPRCISKKIRWTENTIICLKGKYFSSPTSYYAVLNVRNLNFKNAKFPKLCKKNCNFSRAELTPLQPQGVNFPITARKEISRRAFSGIKCQNRCGGTVYHVAPKRRMSFCFNFARV